MWGEFGRRVFSDLLSLIQEDTFMLRQRAIDNQSISSHILRILLYTKSLSLPVMAKDSARYSGMDTKILLRAWFSYFILH